MKSLKFFRCGILVITLLVTIGAASYAEAGTDPYGPQNKRFGIGIIAGEPTGLSLKGYLTSQFAIDAIASWSFVEDSFTLIGDLTYDFFDFNTNLSSFSLPFYAGAGVKIGFDQGGKNDGKTIVGVRIPIGVAMQFVKYPVEVFFEVAPGIEFSPETEFDFTGGIGARFYFF
jgi:hypothetical protein